MRSYLLLFVRAKSPCRDECELRQVPLGALTVRVQLRAELAHNYTNSCGVRAERAGGVPHSQRLRDTTGPTLQSSKTSGGLTKPWDDPKTAKATISPTFHTRRREIMKCENVSSQKSGPLLTGEYRLRVKGGKEYLVTRTYKIQPQRYGSTMGRLRAASRLTGSKRFLPRYSVAAFPTPSN
jgi:hypothetical protein